MKNLSYIALILLVGIACKKEQKPQAEQTPSKQGVLLDTFTQKPIPACRVFLLEYQNGRETIISETYTDSLGHFRFDSISPTHTIQFAANSYSWHSPQDIAQKYYYLSPYVPVHVKINPSSEYLIKELRGSFNNSPLEDPSTKDYTRISAAVYDSLYLGIVKQLKSGTLQYDTSYSSFYIDKSVNYIQLNP